MTSDSPARRTGTFAGALLSTVLVLGVVVASLTVADAAPSSRTLDTAASARQDPDPQVLVISLDGLNPTALRRLGRRGAPHLWRLFDEGAGTLNARTQYEMTITLPNHTSMVTGRRIDRRRGGHGVTWNDDRLYPRTVQRAARHQVASVFSRVDAAGGSTALFTAKTKFSLWKRSWAGSVDRLGIHEEDDAAVIAEARRDLVAHDRELTFVHLGNADKTGHAVGWMTPKYLDAVRGLDRLVGLVLADADAKPALDDLTIVLTADHGGVPGTRNHSQVRRPADYTIPFVAWGPGIDHADLYAINPGYRDPGTGRPGLRGKQPVRNGNVANLVLDLLGEKPVPGSTFGNARPLLVS